MSVSKHVDFMSLGLANFNVKNSLNYLHSQYQLAYYEGFWLVNGMEYHISRNKMQYSDCGLYCSSKQAIIIDDRSEFLTILANFNFDSIWVNTDSNVTTNEGNIVYELFLGNHMIYPKNTIN